MTRVIRYFDKADESYIGEVELPNIPLDKLQEIFQVSSENPMYDSFAIDEKQFKFICEFVQVDLKLKEYDCFLEHDSDDVGQASIEKLNPR